MIEHVKYMKKAIELAKKGRYKNLYNLTVGCVLVKNNKIIGEGYYDSLYSKDHAETKAINNAKEDVSGSSLYVTLEPCFHTGNTPPCVDNIIAHNIKEVIIPFKDPNPLVNGKSISKLEQVGIKVINNILSDECYKLNEEFLYYKLTQKPFLTAKWASSLDGKLSTYTYNSKWISNQASMKQAHIIRSQNVGILVGANTLSLDDPLLNVRYGLKNCTNPIRIILAHSPNININASLWNDASAPNWLIIPDSYANDKNIKDLKIKNVEVIGLFSNADGFIDLEYLLQELGNRGISSLMIEGGSNTLSNFLENRLINKIEIFIAPIIMGGNITAANFINKDFQTVYDAEQFHIIEHNLIEDVMWLSLESKRYISNKKQFIKSLQI